MILNFTFKDYSGNKYDTYAYPGWANMVGWCITFSSILCIPTVAVVKISQAEGSLMARVRHLLTSSPDWGPKVAPPTSVEEGGALLGMPANVEGSAMTLLHNNSSTCVIEREFHTPPTHPTTPPT